MTKVRDIMSPVVFSCLAADSLNQAAHIMWQHDCGCVPIVDFLDRPIGVITDRDICMAAYTQGKPLSEIVISSAYSGKVNTCAIDDPLERAEQIMVEHQVRRLPVVNSDGHLVGMLSLSDLVRHTQFVTPRKASDRSIAATSLVMEAVSRKRPDESQTSSDSDALIAA